MRIAISEDYVIPATLSKRAIRKGLYIDVDTTNPVEITLPPIDAYSENQKIFISDVTGTANENPITIKTDDLVEELISGDNDIIINGSFNTVEMVRVSSDSWTCVYPTKSFPGSDKGLIKFSIIQTGTALPIVVLRETNFDDLILTPSINATGDFRITANQDCFIGDAHISCSEFALATSSATATVNLDPTYFDLKSYASGTLADNVFKGQLITCEIYI